MFNIAVCDDDMLHLSDTVQAVEEQAKPVFTVVNVRGYSSASALLAAISDRAYLPDIAVLDIRMQELSGIELSKKITERLPDCRIIYLTGYLEYAPDVYETQHTYFVLKSQLRERLGSALNKAAEELNSVRSNIIALKNSAGAVTAVRADEVMYLERVIRMTKLVTMEETLEVRQKPEELLEVSGGSRFIHCHQSFWVNYAYIRTMDANEFLLTNGAVVPISRSYKKNARDAFFKLLEGPRSVLMN